MSQQRGVVSCTGNLATWGALLPKVAGSSPPRGLGGTLMILI